MRPTFRWQVYDSGGRWCFFDAATFDVEGGMCIFYSANDSEIAAFANPIRVLRGELVEREKDNGDSDTEEA